ncbi:succinate dehydrogenase subunit 5, mitochondrial-like [Primulina eburnea]|uniref:succinate dehydrogenase subunit 5, mitochondrial-like n=1 Tax=Primulina eburnea TaxID=1245227 RepID=UPI003C6CB632
MVKAMMLRSLCRSICRRSQAFSSSAAVNNHIFHLQLSSSFPATSPKTPPSDFLRPFAFRFGVIRYFSEDTTHIPVIEDHNIKCALKDLLATDWDELPPAVVEDVRGSLSKSTEDKASQEVLKNVFRAAEAVEEFTGIVMSLKMAMDDIIGVSGENVKPLPEEHAKAMQILFDRYAAYLASFGPEENYLKKKVETELGTKMIYLKMRCSGLDADWGKVTVLGTSGISGSYIEHRA